MPDVLTWLRGLPQPLVLLAGGMLVMADSGLLIGLLLPGTSAVLALGVLARLGVVHPALAGVTAALAAVAGTQLAYVRSLGSEFPVPHRFQGARERAAALVGRLGLPAVCLGQWLGPIRTLTPRLAARAGIPYRRFASVSVPTSAAWATALLAVGYLCATAYEALSRWLGFGAIGVAVAVAGVVVQRAGRTRPDS
ncbi:DedA family protein [Kutzneria kofuensis]|uniref:Membrane protein DedA with SNARE-associated domain n=1 Tax=Kutzneria kofuensis TaxID=103725 RepID=A0A7W9NKT4_9PSEU|nr:VTT domain-containing protein [Kutzneria kofuensis]MBB5896034.1 membrane protein DedA with SNARE-associated domain [Kutzneria kofuensis]